LHLIAKIFFQAMNIFYCPAFLTVSCHPERSEGTGANRLVLNADEGGISSLCSLCFLCVLCDTKKSISDGIKYPQRRQSSC
jgi:hypothetical protein